MEIEQQNKIQKDEPFFGSDKIFPSFSQEDINQLTTLDDFVQTFAQLDNFINQKEMLKCQLLADVTMKEAELVSKKIALENLVKLDQDLKKQQAVLLAQEKANKQIKNFNAFMLSKLTTDKMQIRTQNKAPEQQQTSESNAFESEIALEKSRLSYENQIENQKETIIDFQLNNRQLQAIYVMEPSIKFSRMIDVQCGTTIDGNNISHCQIMTKLLLESSSEEIKRNKFYMDMLSHFNVDKFTSHNMTITSSQNENTNK